VRLTFVESKLFVVTAKGVLSDQELRAVQATLLADPQAGAVIQGTHGARKVRVALPGGGKSGGGKSGGARVIYVHVPTRARVYLLLAYPKNVAGTLSAAGRTLVADEIRRILERG